MTSSSTTWNWLHLLSCLLVGVTAVLLSFGALVTTYEAAMAVPDWPATYGHNMFLFPFAEWFHGPWDLFLEHGHRLLGAVVGMITLVLVAVVWRSTTTTIVKALAVAAVLLVVVQGLLGGARVLLDDKTVAKVHACTGPLFFAVAVAVATLTHRGHAAAAAASAGGGRAATALLVAAYVQLVAGAQLRHADATIEPATFGWLVALHVFGACAVAALAAAALVGVPDGPSPARWWARLMVVAVACQFLLGGGAWIANWGLPHGLLPDAWQSADARVARSAWSAWVTTGHVVLGMLILGGSVVLAILSGGFDRGRAANVSSTERAFA
jgi:cytochrome c oxidase assembly protein subunit 15